MQHEASKIHSEVSERLRSQGVILTDRATAMREHEDLVRPHFMTEAVPANTSKFTALHGAFWSGGTFVYVPKGVTVLLDPEELVVKIVHKREMKVEEEVPSAEAAVAAEGEAGAEGEEGAEEAAETKE